MLLLVPLTMRSQLWYPVNYLLTIRKQIHKSVDGVRVHNAVCAYREQGPGNKAQHGSAIGKN